jgi:hypothetical protein
MKVQDELVAGTGSGGEVGWMVGLGSGDRLFASIAPGLGWETECTLRRLAAEKGFSVGAHL